MTDSVKHIIDTVHVYQKDSYELVEKVNSFYDTAWNRLILIGSVSFALIGIVLPLLIQWYQKRSINLSETQLRQNIKDSIKEEKNKLIEEMNILIEEKLKIHDDKIKKMEASAEAKAFHIQGNTNTDRNLFSSALGDYIVACENYLRCENYLNLQILLNAINSSCLPHLSIEEIDDLKITDSADLDRLIKNVDEKDHTNTLLQLTRDIKHKLTKLPKTKKERLAQSDPK